MKTVLAFGDSLTWGYDPTTRGRHPWDARWPNVVASALGDTVDVVTEGLRGRHTAFDHTTSAADCNGAAILPMVLSTHAPIDLVVIMLGTNDVYFGKRPSDVRRGINRLVEVVQHHPTRLPAPHVPKLLLVSPPPPVETEANPDVTPEIARHGAQLAQVIGEEADALGVAFFDAGQVVRVSQRDGIHLEADNTRTLGKALIAPIKVLL